MTAESLEVKLAQLDKPLDVAELTTADIKGTGVFDVLMQSVKAHVKEEHQANRITGKEYATVYLEALQTTQGNAIDYLLKAKLFGYEMANLEKQGKLLDAQIAIAVRDEQLRAGELVKQQAETDLIQQQVRNAEAESHKIPLEVKNLQTQGKILIQEAKLKEAQVEIAHKESTHLAVQILQAQHQADLTEQQVKNAEAESHKIPVELAILRNQLKVTDNEILLKEVQVDLSKVQRDQAMYDLANKSPAEVAILGKQVEQADSQIKLTDAQVVKITEENKLIPHTIDKIKAEITNMVTQAELAAKELELKASQLLLQGKQLLLADAELEIRKAELDVKRAEIQSAQAQAQLYAAKVLTEQAQTRPTADANSVLGANITVLKAQADGYKRDAEQKATKILVDTWNVRRNTDEGTEANSTNRLNDTTIGSAIASLLRGAGITY